jgi:hypothetical protein
VADLEGNVGKTISRYHDHTILEPDVPAHVVALILVLAAGEACLPPSHQQHDTCHFARTSFRCRCRSYNTFTVVFLQYISCPVISSRPTVVLQGG